MVEVTARFGPGAVVPTWDPDVFVARGWYDPAERVYLLVYRSGDATHRDRNARGAPPVVSATLATVGHLQAEQWHDKALTVKDLGRPRLPLKSLSGPNGIKLGDARNTVFRILGAGELAGRRGDIDTYSYYNVYPGAHSVGCAEAGFFILQVTFTGGRLTKIHVREAS